MRSYSLFLIPVLVFAVAGCGDSSGKPPAGTGGSVTGSGGGTGTGSGGSPDGSGGIGTGSGGTLGAGGVAVGSGGSAGSSETGAGGSNRDAGTDYADTREANADHAASQADALAGAGVCPVFEPCGGNVVGTWYLSSECRQSSALSSCLGGYDVSFVRESTIVYTFNADGTFKVSTPNPLRLIMRTPIVCLGSDAGAAQACSDYESKMQQQIPGLADAGTSTTELAGFTCQAESDQACLCNEDLRMPAATLTGNYSVSGNQMTTTGLTATPTLDGGIVDAGAGETAEYCVSGNTLRYRSTSGSGLVATMTK